MAAATCLVINVDCDPDPPSVHQDDASILAKCARIRAILAAEADSKAAVSILTGPVCRDRFLQPEYLSFWRSWKQDGAALVLHPEEDFYGPPPDQAAPASAYTDSAHMRRVITDKMKQMRRAGLAFDAYRGGSHGLTSEIAHILESIAIPIDLSCAPGIVCPDSAASWVRASASAYYMQRDQVDVVAASDADRGLFEIPLAWSGACSASGQPMTDPKHYLVCEFSDLPSLERVWDCIRARRDREARTQIVSMMCHAYVMGDPDMEARLIALLRYIKATGGEFLTPGEAKQHFDLELKQ